jgi:hypothetical protein
MKKKLAFALCFAALATTANARNAEDYWCGTPRIHLMMWIAKVQEPSRDAEGKLIRDNEGNLSWGRAADGRTYSQYGVINHKLPENDPRRVTVVPNQWISETGNDIYFRGQKCTVFTEKDQDKYGVGYYGPRWDLRFPHIQGKIAEVIKPATKSNKYECQVTVMVEDRATRKPKTISLKNERVLIEVVQNPPKMEVSYIDNKGNVAERNKQYQDGSYVLLSTDSADPTNEMASPVLTLFGSRKVGSTFYRMVGKMTLDGEGPLFYSYYEEIYKDDYLDATIRAGKCSERK